MCKDRKWVRTINHKNSYRASPTIALNITEVELYRTYNFYVQLTERTVNRINEHVYYACVDHMLEDLEANKGLSPPRKR